MVDAATNTNCARYAHKPAARPATAFPCVAWSASPNAPPTTPPSTVSSALPKSAALEHASHGIPSTPSAPDDRSPNGRRHDHQRRTVHRRRSRQPTGRTWVAALRSRPLSPLAVQPRRQPSRRRRATRRRRLRRRLSQHPAPPCHDGSPGRAQVSHAVLRPTQRDPNDLRGSPNRGRPGPTRRTPARIVLPSR